MWNEKPHVGVRGGINVLWCRGTYSMDICCAFSPCRPVSCSWRCFSDDIGLANEMIRTLALLAFTASPAVADSAVNCLARAIYHEANTESLQGQLAVARVVLNRASGDVSQVCRVVYAKGQFSPHIKRPVQDAQAYDTALLFLAGELTEPDCAESATHFHTTAVRPSWAGVFAKLCSIGAHVFYSGDK
jgi:spore germination cell wall hydrolase CwlJ-like protein